MPILRGYTTRPETVPISLADWKGGQSRYRQATLRGM